MLATFASQWRLLNVITLRKIETDNIITKTIFLSSTLLYCLTKWDLFNVNTLSCDHLNRLIVQWKLLNVITDNAINRLM